MRLVLLVTCLTSVLLLLALQACAGGATKADPAPNAAAPEPEVPKAATPASRAATVPAAKVRPWSGSIAKRTARLPDLNRPVAGVIIAHKNINDLDWRRLGERFNLLHIDFGLDPKDPAANADLVLAMLEEAASTIPGHPEIRQAGVVLGGWSRSGAGASVTADQPKLAHRVLAVVCYYMVTSEPMVAPDGVPLLVLSAAADKDRWSGLLEPVRGGYGQARDETQGQLILRRASQIGVPVTVISHTSNSHAALDRPIDWRLVCLWLEEVLAQRLPEKTPADGPVVLPDWKNRAAWRGAFDVVENDGSAPWGTGERLKNVLVAPANQYKDKRPWIWLPSERFAKAWEYYSRTGLMPGDSAPVEVTIASTGGSAAGAKAYAAITPKGSVSNVVLLAHGSGYLGAEQISVAIAGGSSATTIPFVYAPDGAKLPAAGPGVARVERLPVQPDDKRIGQIAFIDVAAGGTDYPFRKP